MFGYVITNFKSLTDDQRERFRAMYCGMCKTLKRRYGNLERFTLSYDMTFLALVLSALYEPEEQEGYERCAAHPLRPHKYVLNSMMDYAVDMNVALAYHKCADNWEDDRNPAFMVARLALKNAYAKVRERHHDKCCAIEEWMKGIQDIENSGKEEIDPPMNLTGKMLGTLFSYRDDYWADALYRMGDGLGRFIYFMDAYDDLERDVRKKKYNPLKPLRAEESFEDICKRGLSMMIADCADAFEELPVVRDADLIRNIIYSGVWSKYGYIQKKKANRKGAQ